MNDKIKEMVCIVCPIGCKLRVDYTDIEDIIVTGNSCFRGIKYAYDEILDPKRVITSSVLVMGGNLQLASVKTKEAIKKDLIAQALKQIKSVKINAPIKIGDIIIENIANSGVDLVATREVYRAS